MLSHYMFSALGAIVADRQIDISQVVQCLGALVANRQIDIFQASPKSVVAWPAEEEAFCTHIATFIALSSAVSCVMT